MKGKDKCQWLLLGSTDLCQRSCMNKYCKIHLMRLRKGGGTLACKKCGKGVKTALALCKPCGAHNINCQRLMAAQYCFKREFKRLAMINADIFK